MKRLDSMGVLGAGLLLLLAGAIFSGCSSKEDRALYAKIRENSGRLTALQQSEKLIINQGKENETILMVTYLPDESSDMERFVISGTPAGRVNTATLARSEVEGRHPLKIQRVEKRELPVSLRKSTPSWFAIYRVTYPHSEKKKIAFRLSIDGVEKGLYFYKGPKYLIDKKEFKTF